MNVLPDTPSPETLTLAGAVPSLKTIEIVSGTKQAGGGAVVAVVDVVLVVVASVVVVVAPTVGGGGATTVTPVTGSVTAVDDAEVDDDVEDDELDGSVEGEAGVVDDVELPATTTTGGRRPVNTIAFDALTDPLSRRASTTAVTAAITTITITMITGVLRAWGRPTTPDGGSFPLTSSGTVKRVSRPGPRCTDATMAE